MGKQLADEAREMMVVYAARIKGAHAVKEKFEERRAFIQSELDRWQQKMTLLLHDHEEADSVIRDCTEKLTALQRQIEEISLPKLPKRSETKAAKAMRLKRELDQLEREIAREGR